MEFKDIFNPLKKCLGDGNNRQYFFRDLMAMITTVTEEEWGTPLDPNTKRVNDRTIFNYINRGLSQSFAQSIVNRLNPIVLEERINERPHDTRVALAGELSPYDDNINADNVGKYASQMLVSIIKSAAGLLSDEDINAEREAVRAAQLKIKYGPALLQESNNVCHYSQCGKQLYKMASGKIEYVYEVCTIDETKKNTFSNLIALCPDCKAKYCVKHSPKQLSELKRIKKSLVQKCESISSTDGVHLLASDKDQTLSEEDELKVRAFIIHHEGERELIPLCQIAFAYDHTHNHVRNMYTEYCLLPYRIRKSILQNVGFDRMIDIESLEWLEGLANLYDDSLEFNLSFRDYLDSLLQYFPKSINFLNMKIQDIDIRSFDRIIVPKCFASLKAARKCDLDTYIDDYLYIQDNELEYDVPRPLDYLWLRKKLYSCSEKEVAFWFCHYVIDACNNIGWRLKGNPLIVDGMDMYAETLEDLFYSALNVLHNHHSIHKELDGKRSSTE